LNAAKKVMTRRRHQYAKARRIIYSGLYRRLGSLNRFIQPASYYGIKPGYHHARHSLPFDDTGNKDEWQDSVYQYALELFRKNQFNSVIDLGCGSGFKLLKYFSEFVTTGIEVRQTSAWLRSTYPDRNWIDTEDMIPRKLQTDMVICADVIEHLSNPDQLLDAIRSIPCRLILISSPARELVAGPFTYGPPLNPSHFREWNGQEFHYYLSGWFDLQEQCIFNDRSPTQVIVCNQKSI
jgi:SAM-dependent methyltransferase